jgi:hypothetical protein
MLRCGFSAVIGVVLVACGAASPQPSVLPEDDGEHDCDAITARAEAARRALDSCQSQSPTPSWSEREAFEWLEARLDAQLGRAEGDEGPDLGIVARQEIAEHVWALLDELPEAEREPAIISRIENASEQLLHPQDPEERDSTFAELAGALGVLRDRLEPAPVSGACDAEGRASAEAWMQVEAFCSPNALAESPTDP